MKHGKRPTRAQKMALKQVGLSPDNWLVVKVTGGMLEITHRHTGTQRKIPNMA